MTWVIVLLVLFCLYQGHEAEVTKGKEHGTKGTKSKEVTVKKIDFGCLENWTRESDRCYYIGAKPASFDEAKKHCESLESELIPPLSCIAMFGLSVLLINQRDTRPIYGQNLEWWIGLQDSKGTNNWTTTKGVTFDKKRQSWDHGFPQGKGRCAVLSFHSNKWMGAWRNDNCAKQFKFVCVRCPDRFEYAPEVDSCFYLNLKKNKWKDAREACSKIKMGGEMLTIKSEAKQKAVRRYLERQFTKYETEVCVDTNRKSGGKVAWINGQTKDPKDENSPYVWKPMYAAEKPFRYNNWYPGMPDRGFMDMNCAAIATSKKLDYHWEDNICFIPLCSICEF